MLKNKNMLREDNNGFVNFPIENKLFVKMDIGKTMIYLVAFDSQDIANIPYTLSNTRILMPGNFVSDDITQRPKVKQAQLSIDDLVDYQIRNNEYDRVYFPNDDDDDDEKPVSIPITSAICLGWNDNTFELRDTNTPWSANFRDLTHEGKKLYYSIKKLHNNKEVRILTFNNI